MPGLYAFDTETHLIKPGCLAPRMVCLSWAWTDQVGTVSTEIGIQWIRARLEAGDTLVGHNIAYDVGITVAEDPSLLPLWFKAYDEGRVICTQITQQVLDVEAGELGKHRYTLAALSKRWLGTELDKSEDTWRMRYSLLTDVPLDEWPEEARQYAEDDAKTTLAVHKEQARALDMSKPSVYQQYQAGLALHLISMWGMRTDDSVVSELRQQLEERFTECEDKARDAGLLSSTGSKNMKAIRAVVENLWPDEETRPKTPGGKTATDRKTLEAFDDDGLKAIVDMGKVGKLLQTYVPVLEQGTKVPINPRYNPILETYRTSCRTPNMQNLPREGGVRRSFVPRPGHVYGFCDYDTLELRSLAQVTLDLFGESHMADALREGKDLHLQMAAAMLNIPYEEAASRRGDTEIRQARQFAKIANFGFPGGMGAEKLVLFAAANRVDLTVEKAQELRDLFLSTWTEMGQYFRHCGELAGYGGADEIEFLRSGLKRGKVKYTAVCNGYFQHLAAMGAKQATYRAVQECFGYPRTALTGARVVLFLHDEIGLEVREKDAPAAAERLQKVMVDTMQEWIPSVPITASPVLMRRWYKGAEPVRVHDILVPCKPEKRGDDTIWIPDQYL